MEESVAELLTI